MAEGAQRHHFISQCYLRGFTPDPAAPRLYAVDFRARKAFWPSPVDVALEKRFHTIDVPGESPNLIEDMISKFESELSPALRRISEVGSLADDGDRGLLFYFMALLSVKLPDKRDTVDDIVDRISAVVMERIATDPGVWAAKMEQSKADGVIDADADTDAMRNSVLERDFTYGLSTTGHLQMELELAPKLLPFFHGRKWMVAVAEGEATHFVTSDDPVRLMWKDRTVTEPIGLGVANTEILFAVSNKVAIYGTFEGTDGVVPANDDLVAAINGNIIAGARRQVYARGDDFIYEMPHHHLGRWRGSEILNDPLVSKFSASPST